MQQSLYLEPFWHSGGPGIHEDAVPSPISCSWVHSPAGGWFPSASDTKLWQFSQINMLLKTERNCHILKIIIWVYIYIYSWHASRNFLCIWFLLSYSTNSIKNQSINVWLQGQPLGAFSLCVWGDSRTQPMSEPCLCSDSANSRERLHCGCLPLLNPF